MSDDISLSTRTLNILKNFTKICEHIIIDKGNRLYTSKGGTIFAWTEVEDNFPFKIPLYDLAQFISIVEKQDNPLIEFKREEDRVHIFVKKGRSRVRYLCSPVYLVEKKFPSFPFPEGDIPPDAEHVARVGRDNIKKLKKIVGTMGFDAVQLILRNGVATLRALESKKPQGNFFEIGLAKKLDFPDFTVSVDFAKFVMVDDDYDLYVIPEKGLFFKGDGQAVNYLITLDVALSEFSNSDKNIEEIPF